MTFQCHEQIPHRKKCQGRSWGITPLAPTAIPCWQYAVPTINISPSAKRVLPPDSQQWNGGKLWSREHVGALNNSLYSLHSKVDMTGWWWRTCRPKFFEHVIMILKFSTSAGVRPPMVRTYIIHTLAILDLFSRLNFLWHFFLPDFLPILVTYHSKVGHSPQPIPVFPPPRSGRECPL